MCQILTYLPTAAKLKTMVQNASPCKAVVRINLLTQMTSFRLPVPSPDIFPLQSSFAKTGSKLAFSTFYAFILGCNLMSETPFHKVIIDLKAVKFSDSVLFFWTTKWHLTLLSPSSLKLSV
jgi:hypothetical protein